MPRLPGLRRLQRVVGRPAGHVAALVHLRHWVPVRALLSTNSHPIEARFRRWLGTDWTHRADAPAAASAYARWARTLGLGKRPLANVTRRQLADAAEATAQGRFDDAYDVLELAGTGPDGLHPAVLLARARAAMARSSYRRADVLFAMAAQTRSADVEAAAGRARVAWILHDPTAERLAHHVLSLDPNHRGAASILDRVAAKPMAPAQHGLRLAHAAFHVGRGGNFGDVSLPVAVREAIGNRQAVTSWHEIHVHQLVGEAQLEAMNATAGVIVGGGGLFLPDTSPNGHSGWQWNITTERLKRIRVPLAVVAVGYNLFRGQAFEGDRFDRSLQALVERATVVGLRNHGSVDKVRERLPPHLADKISFLPCPTTVLRHIHPAKGRAVQRTDEVLLNVAYDRSERRFGRGYQAFLAAMAAAVRPLLDKGVPVAVAAHLPSDERFARDLEVDHAIKLPVHQLHAMDLEQGYDVYRRAGVVIGMRGHATMIPFGLGTPVRSIISHPKLRYFLDDIDRPRWGCDVASPDLSQWVVDESLRALDHADDERRDVEALQEPLLRAVQSGVDRFLDAVPGAQ